MQKRIRYGLPALLLFFLLCGCGGGDQTSGTGTGRAVLTIEWPERTRLIPEASNSLQILIRQGSQTASLVLLGRPPQDGIQNISFSQLPAGQLTVTATTYPNADGTGAAQAIASAPLLIQDNQETTFSLTMVSTIERIEVSPQIIQLLAGAFSSATATARDGAGSAVLMSPNKTQWTSDNPSVATVNNAGSITGVAVGSTQIRFTDTESGKSGSATITVL